MIIITWKQRTGGHRGGDVYTMRAVIKPVSARTDPPFIIEREYTDAAGGRGWIPATHGQAVTIICKAFLQLAGPLTLVQIEQVEAARAKGAPLSIDLGILDLPEG